MSLHRRITAAAAFAVAAACLVFAPVGYLATRAKLLQEVKLELARLAQPFLGSRTGARRSVLRPPASDVDSTTGTCTFGLVNGDSGVDAALGGPTGYVQSVCPDGRVIARNGGTPQLPVTPRVRAVARRLEGAYYFTTVVERTRLEILVTPDVSDRKAIEVAVPLTTTDSALRSLAVTYALLVAGGIALAGLIGALIARAALAPIRHFTSQTERVAGSLDVQHRLAEHGATEIRRLAADGIEAFVICPVGFVSDHLEVLYDIDIDARAVARDAGATLLSFEIARTIERQLEYPGQIKVTVIRESRAVDYAR